MADTITIPATGSGTATPVVATDDAGASGHVQIVKLAHSTDGSATPITADANGLEVQGAGVAGTPAGGVASVQGVSGGTALPVSAASLPLPSGAATESTLDARTGALTETAPATDTASSGINGRLQRVAQRLTSLIALLPSALGAGGGLKVDGSGTALPVSGTVAVTGVATESTLDTRTGSLTETAPATDTASSGINGRLQRIAQRLTTLLNGGLPAALGAGGGLKVDGSGTALPVSAASLPLPTGAATAALQGGGLPAALAAGGGLKVEGVAGGIAVPVSVGVALPAGTNNIGDVDVLSIAAGDNNIGNVDIVTVPADPFGANADASSATGSISAKLRAAATALEVIDDWDATDRCKVVATDKWDAAVAAGSNLLTTELNSLANGAYSAVGTEYDNSTSLNRFMALEINLASLNPTAGAFIELFLTVALGGTNYEDPPSSTNPGRDMLIGTKPITTGLGTKRASIRDIEIPPCKFKLVLYNATNVSLGASGNTVTPYFYNKRLGA